MVALLRGINVGGRGKLPMADLRAIATDLGYDDVATYIQSGNLVLTSREQRGLGGDGTWRRPSPRRVTSRPR